MCRAASFVVTKDKVFWSKMTDSHEEIIREFDLCPEVAGKACVVRCEIVPDGRRYDSDPATWAYKTDQDADTLPKWFDAADVEARARVALAEWVSTRVIKSGIVQDVESGVHFFICGAATVKAICGSATVEYIGGLATVEYIGGSATVESICGSATVKAICESATVKAICESATVKAIGESATVNAIGGLATVEYIGGSATVKAICGSATVKAICESATVKAIYGAATVKAIYGLATVESICESATVSFYCAFSCHLAGKSAVVINRVYKENAKCYVGKTKDRIVSG